MAKFWQSEPEELTRERAALRFKQRAKAARVPRLPGQMPQFDPTSPLDQPGEPKGPPVGPQAAERFRERADAQRETWRKGLLEGLPASGQTEPSRGGGLGDTLGRVGETVGKGLGFLGERLAPEVVDTWQAATEPEFVPEWVRQRGSETVSQYQEQPTWQRVLSQGSSNLFTQMGGGEDLPALREELRRRVQGLEPQMGDEQWRQAAGGATARLGIIATGMTEAPKVAGKAVRGKKGAAKQEAVPEQAVPAEPPEVLRDYPDLPQQAQPAPQPPEPAAAAEAPRVEETAAIVNEPPRAAPPAEVAPTQPSSPAVPPPAAGIEPAAGSSLSPAAGTPPQGAGPSPEIQRVEEIARQAKPKQQVTAFPDGPDALKRAIASKGRNQWIVQEGGRVYLAPVKMAREDVKAAIAAGQITEAQAPKLSPKAPKAKPVEPALAVEAPAAQPKPDLEAAREEVKGLPQEDLTARLQEAEQARDSARAVAAIEEMQRQADEAAGVPPQKPAETVPAEPPAGPVSDLAPILQGLEAIDVKPNQPLRERLGRAWRFGVSQAWDVTAVLKHTQKQVEKAQGKPVSLAQNAAIFRQVLPGAARAAEQFMDLNLKPILATVPKADWPYLEAYLIKYDQVDKAAAVGNPDRHWSWGTRPERLQATLDDMKARLGPERFARIEEAAQAVWAYNHRLLEMKMDAGLVSQEAFVLLTQNFPHYSPIRVFDYLTAMGEGRTGGARNITVSQNGLKHLSEYGTERAMQHPLEAIASLTYETHGLAFRNRAGQRFAAWRKAPGMDAVIREVPDTYKVKGDEAVFQVWEDGELKRFIIPKDLDAAVRYQSIDMGPVFNSLAELLGTPLRLGATALNPQFALVRNPIGDVLDAMIREGITPQQYLAATKEVITQGPQYRGYIEYGGGQAGYFDRTRPKRALEQLTAKPLWKLENPQDLGRLAWYILRLGPIEGVGGRIEQIPRVATYAKRRKAGQSGWEAAAAGRSVTMDFSEQGQVMARINAFVPFTQVAVKSPVQVWRTFGGQSSARAAATRIALGLAVPALLAELDNRRHPEYEDVPEYVKARSLVWMLPWSGRKKDRFGNVVPEYVEIPARQWAPVVASVRLAVDTFQGRSEQGYQALLKSMSQAWNPIQGEGVAEPAAFFLPPGLSSILEIGSNRDWYRSRDIVPREREHLLATEQYRPETTESAKLLARGAGLFKWLPVLGNLAAELEKPAMLEHFVKANLAGMGGTGLSAGDAILAALGRGKPLPGIKEGEKPWAWWVPQEGEAQMLPAAQIERLTQEAKAGKGSLYVVAGRDQAAAQEKVYARQFLAAVNEPSTPGQIPGVGGLIGTFYGTRQGGNVERVREYQKKLLGEKTVEQTQRAWSQLRPKLEEIKTEQLAVDAKLERGEWSGNQWRDAYHSLQERKRGIFEGAGAILPGAAITGDRARQYRKAAATLALTAPDKRSRTELLVETLTAIQPQKGVDNLPDMDQYFADRKAFLSGLSATDRKAVQEELEKNATPVQEEYYRARDLYEQYREMPKWRNVDKAEEETMLSALRQLNARRADFHPAMPNRTLAALKQLQDEKGKEVARLAWKALKAPQAALNRDRQQFWYDNRELLNRFYSDLERAESAEEEPAGQMAMAGGE